MYIDLDVILINRALSSVKIEYDTQSVHAVLTKITGIIPIVDAFWWSLFHLIPFTIILFHLQYPGSLETTNMIGACTHD